MQAGKFNRIRMKNSTNTSILLPSSFSSLLSYQPQAVQLVVNMTYICKGSGIRPLYDQFHSPLYSSSDGYFCTGKLNEFPTFYREMTKKNYKCQNLLNSSILHQTDECQKCALAEYGEEDTITDAYDLTDQIHFQTSTSHTNGV